MLSSVLFDRQKIKYDEIVNVARNSGITLWQFAMVPGGVPGGKFSVFTELFLLYTLSLRSILQASDKHSNPKDD